MSISLSNAMKLGKFSACEVVAGQKGMARVIENITVMEVPEIVQWLKGRELILTSLFAIKDDLDAQNMLVQNLHNAGASGLAIKPSQFIKTIPKGIINSANKLGFPIIKIPDDVKYLDILSPVMHHIFNEKVVLQEDVEQATKILDEISLNSQGVDELVEHVSYLTRNMITIESELSFIKVPTSEKSLSPLDKDQIDDLTIIQRPIQYSRKYGEEILSCIVAPIMVDRKYYGNITCWEVNNEHLATDLAIIEKASSLLSLEFLRLKVKYDVEQQYKNEFIRELLFSENIKEKNVIEWGEKYGINKQDKYVCLLCTTRSENAKTKHNITLNHDQINSIIQNVIPGVLVGHISGNVCIILSAHQDMAQIYHEIYDRLTQYIGSTIKLYLGIGRVGTGPAGIQKSYIQADQALYLSDSIKDAKGITYYDDLGLFRLINQLKDQEELFDFYQETIGQLVEQDKNHELLKTLKTYFYHDEVLKDTANNMYIHVNTLKYRIKKIEEITGFDMKRSEGKMNLYFGLKIYELLFYNKR